MKACKQKPEPNLVKLAEDHALGRILGDIEDAAEGSGDDEL